MNNLIHTNMEECHRNRELMSTFYPDTNQQIHKGYNSFNISLGRQMGHSTGIVKFVEEHGKRCLVLAGSSHNMKYMKDILQDKSLEPCFIIGYESYRLLEKRDFDILIIDEWTWAERKLVIYVSNLIRILGEVKNLHSVYYIG